MIVPDWHDAFTHNLHCRCSLRATVIYDIAQDSDVDAVEENEAALSNQKNHNGGNDTQWHYVQVENSNGTFQTMVSLRQLDVPFSRWRE